MTPRADRIPFVTRARPPCLERAVYAHCLQAISRGSSSAKSVAQIARDRWPDDSGTELLTKAASSPTARTALSQDLVSDFVGSLAPMAAAPRLMGVGMRVDITGRNSTKLPRRQSGGKAATTVPWIAEAAPMPVKNYVLDTCTLGPAYKLASISALTREMVIHSS
jgi:hypothetical protein